MMEEKEWIIRVLYLNVQTSGTWGIVQHDFCLFCIQGGHIKMKQILFSTIQPSMEIVRPAGNKKKFHLQFNAKILGYNVFFFFLNSSEIHSQ